MRNETLRTTPTRGVTPPVAWAWYEALLLAVNIGGWIVVFWQAASIEQGPQL